MDERSRRQVLRLLAVGSTGIFTGCPSLNNSNQSSTDSPVEGGTAEPVPTGTTTDSATPTDTASPTPEDTEIDTEEPTPEYDGEIIKSSSDYEISEIISDRNNRIDSVLKRRSGYETPMNWLETGDLHSELNDNANGTIGYPRDRSTFGSGDPKSYQSFKMNEFRNAENGLRALSWVSTARNTFELLVTLDKLEADIDAERVDPEGRPVPEDSWVTAALHESMVNDNTEQEIVIWPIEIPETQTEGLYANGSEPVFHPLERDGDQIFPAMMMMDLKNEKAALIHPFQDEWYSEKVFEPQKEQKRYLNDEFRNRVGSDFYFDNSMTSQIWLEDSVMVPEEGYQGDGTPTPTPTEVQPVDWNFEEHAGNNSFGAGQEDDAAINKYWFFAGRDFQNPGMKGLDKEEAKQNIIKNIRYMTEHPEYQDSYTAWEDAETVQIQDGAVEQIQETFSTEEVNVEQALQFSQMITENVNKDGYHIIDYAPEAGEYATVETDQETFEQTAADEDVVEEFDLKNGELLEPTDNTAATGA